jgi:hypothetical protein
MLHDPTKQPVDNFDIFLLVLWSSGRVLVMKRLRETCKYVRKANKQINNRKRITE